ncbi:MAG TPA: hypothetical protein VFD32_22100 [Dehalococcoidia bacterium]|nr:hypothetical protein [Dehalococcoidia bacterium]
MAALRSDANVLVRYLTGLPEEQYLRAATLVDAIAAHSTRITLEDVASLRSYGC